MSQRWRRHLKYDAENRLVKVSSDSGGSAYIARFAYDGDGKRVKRVDNYGTIHYVGPHYERNVGTGRDTTETITKFYHAEMGKIRRLLALSRGGVFRYICPDHLGGTARTTDVSGNNVDDIRYHAFGATRSGGTNTPTDKRYTGQTLDLATGLYWYVSRSYDSALGRFAQPDTIVPDYKNPQALNRYSYTYNNPLSYVDPSGHQPGHALTVTPTAVPTPGLPTPTPTPTAITTGPLPAQAAATPAYPAAIPTPTPTPPPGYQPPIPVALAPTPSL